MYIIKINVFIIKAEYGRTISNMGVPSQIWAYHLKYGRTISNMGVPSQIWAYHLKYGRTISNMGVPSQIWAYHLKYGRTISNMGVPSQIWAYHLKYGRTMSTIYGNLDKIIAIAIMLISSLYLRILLQLIGQNWIKTIAHTATLTLLPILTYVITSVISGNIALSLGMVGALSIVRFRNPVRSPLELSIYFGAITMGITAAVSLIWLILLLGSITLVALILTLLHLASTKFSAKPFFVSSFSEGNNLSTLVITSGSEIQALDDSDYLMAKISNSNEVTYTLAHADFKGLQNIGKSMQSSGSIKNIQLSR